MTEGSPRHWKRWVLGEWSWWRLARSVVEVYSLMLVAVLVLDGRLMFRPPPCSYRDDRAVRKLPTVDGASISARYYESPGARHTLLLSHGNAEDIGQLSGLARDITGLGFTVLTYDYRGYGTSGGTPSESASYLDIDAAYEWLIRERRVSPRHIILYGRSLGAGPSIDLATRREVGGLLLEGAFVSAYRVVTHVPVFPFDRFRNLSKIGKVRCPLLVVHAEHDSVVPAWHGKRLFEEARSPKIGLFPAVGDHIDAVWTSKAAFRKALRELEQLVDSADAHGRSSGP